MKKVVSIALALTLLLSMALFTACSGDTGEEMTTPTFTDTEETTLDGLTDESESETEADETSSSNPGNVELTTTENETSTDTSKAQ